MIKPTIPPEVRKLCGQVAAARTRRATWDLARDLRAEVLRRTRAGESAETVQAWLREEHAAALAAQTR